MTLLVPSMAGFGCGSGDDPNAAPTAGQSLDASTDSPLDGSRASAREAGQCLEQSAVSCSCASGGQGTRTCRSGSFGACENCTTTPVTESKCVAGRYEGNFSMSYRSGPAGICGVIADPSEERASGHWDFSLFRQDLPDTYVVSAGCLSAGMSTNADGTMTPPIKASVTGLVECGTGTLSGEIKGYYKSTSVCTLGTVVENFFFKGTMTGTFDPVTRSFIDTHVQFMEPPVAIPPQPGGEGTWTAVLDPDASVGMDTTDCLDGLTFPDDKFPATP